MELRNQQVGDPGLLIERGNHPRFVHKAKAFTRESRFLVESRPERYWYQ